MIYTLKSKDIEIKVKSKGAELVSFKNKDKEYIWNKETIWAKSSPILFPFVGTTKDSYYTYKNKRYEVDTKHGFAKDSEFELVSKTENSLILKITSNEKTKKSYPFDFEFFVIYRIEDEKMLSMELKVKSLNEEEMYFSLGTHPGIVLSDNYEKSVLKFDKEFEIKSYALDGPFIDLSSKVEFGKKDNIQLKDDNFNIDTIIIDGNNVDSTTIVENSKKIIKIRHVGFPYLAYWKAKKANFICIESWVGLPDINNTDHKIENKLGIQKLKKGEEYFAKIFFEL